MGNTAFFGGTVLPDAVGVATLAPGRVNLIGEHTDYTGGLVLPMAIPFWTRAEVRAVGTGYVFSSALFDSVRRTEAGETTPRIGEWSDYPVGVLRELEVLGIAPPPFHLHIGGNVPLGAGLSSSASVEVATALALLRHAGRSLPAAEIARLCQRAENRYVGSPCGIMDQFVVTAARAGYAMLLHTRELSIEHLPLTTGALASCRVVVVNSMVRHSIGGGEYGARRRELEEGQAVLRATFPGLRDLGDATLDQLECCAAAMSAGAFRRCRHVVTENARVRQAAEAMQAGDAARLGTLMSLAHESYRDDFGASVPEVDFLVDTALGLPGCHGARLTGGGFGGCTVNLVEASQVDAFARTLREAYRAQWGIAADVYVCEAAAGALELAEGARA